MAAPNETLDRKPCKKVQLYFMTDQFESIGCYDLENIELDKSLLMMHGQIAGNDIMSYEHNLAVKFYL